MKKRHIKNTRKAYSIMAGIPAEKIKLDYTRVDFNESDEVVSDEALLHTCGASGCIAGWLSAHPYFKKRGLEFGSSGTISYKGEFGLHDAAWHLFGDVNIFNSGARGLDGKLQALERLRWHLYRADAISDERNAELIREEEAMTS